MAQLVFLTGAPGSGKSTLARLLVESRPLALLLDLDTLRAQLGDWKADPAAAGVRTRHLALAAARAQLELGADVVVPQFVRRPELIEQFRVLAADVGARFVLVALVSSPEEAAERFRTRRTSADPNHHDAAHLQDLAGAAPIGELYADMLAMLAGFPETVQVESVPGEVEATLAALRAVLRP
ncbi:MAG TPA: AAA family ATPase [Propionicimonas sp.]|jgi:predicted kinase|uniref:AAA family ATPase n=1 Tax=Propionicimonas sp. TaxID=1955623 RepID=UPI002F3FDCF5